MRKIVSGQLEIVMAALLFSTGGAAIKACSFSSWQIAGLRSVIAAAALMLLIRGARPSLSPRVLGVAAVYSGTMILFVAANKLTTSMNSIFLQDTAPLYVMLLSPLLLGERIRARDISIMAVIAIGLAMFFLGGERPQQTAPRPLLGNVFAAASGMTWALTIMGLRWLGKESGAQRIGLSAVVTGNLLTCLVCLPIALPIRGADMTDWLAVGFLGIFQIGLAYLCLTKGLVHTPAFTAAILLLIEPVFNPAWSFLLHREVPGAWALAGAALILGATLFKARLDAAGRAQC